MTATTHSRAHWTIIERNRSWAGWLLDLVRESRPAVQFVFLLRAVAGTGLVRSPSLSAVSVVAGWWMLTTAVYLFNGVTDVAADQGNASRRPIASGRLRLSDALVACAALSMGGVALCGYAGVTDLLLAMVFVALGWAYSAGPAWKNGPVTSTAVIGAGAGLTYAAGLMCRHQASVRDAVVALALAVWVGTCCASKDFSDAPGDRLAGRRTWPVLFGSQRAAQLLATSAALVGVAILTVSFEFDKHQFPVGCVLVLGSVILAAVVLRTASSPKRDVRRRGYRAFMTTQYATNLTMILAG